MKLKLKENIPFEKLEELGFDDECTNIYHKEIFIEGKDSCGGVIEIRVDKKTRMVTSYFCTVDIDTNTYNFSMELINLNEILKNNIFEYVEY